jgi:PAS domain S-box-containing protein
MSVLITLLTADPSLYVPQSLVGRLIAGLSWLLFLGCLVLLIRHWWGYNVPVTPKNRMVLALLVLAVPFTSLLFGLQLPVQGSLSLPWLPVEPAGPAMMFFAAIPWMLAGGLFGPLSAALLAALGGIFQALWDTHNPFTPLELALLAVLFSAAVRQRYRTPVYAWLRQPAVAALLLAFLYPFLYLLTTILFADGGLVVRLDYAQASVVYASLAMGGELLIGGLAAQAFALASPQLWRSHETLLPSPSEKSLQARYIYAIAPVVGLLAVLLVVGGWFIAERAASQMMRDRLADAAVMASDGIPFFFEAGQNLITRTADDPRLLSQDEEALRNALSDELRQVPFFTQLYILDKQGQAITGYPDQRYPDESTTIEEQAGVQSVLAGVAYQDFTLPPAEGNSAATISLVAPIEDKTGDISRVLVGRTNLSENPMTQPILSILENLAGSDGAGMLLDEDGRIVYHSAGAPLMTPYTGRIPQEAEYFDETAPEGTRQLTFFQPVSGKGWSVVLGVPARRVQQLALNIAVPLMGMILLLGIFSIFLLRYSLRSVTGSLGTLANQARNISQGELDNPLPATGEDEVGQLRQAFEQMRLSLKARLEEQNRLLLVSQGVASSLEIGEAVKPVLQAALASGASSARVVLSPSSMPELTGPLTTPAAFAQGPATQLYADLDEQILNLTRQQERVVLNNLGRTRVVTFKPGVPRPKALLAIPLRHESQYYGAMWVAYDQPHAFSEEEVRFIATLAGYAALASANARLFSSAELGRQRLSAILASTPDPVLVTDQQNCLLLANPAAWRALGVGVDWDEGQPIERVVTQEALLRLLRSPGDEKRSDEVKLNDGKEYYATASTIMADGKRMGRVCVMRDITHFKQLDALKSEFVATVSHDLRSPLTLIRGYASMLEMVGELNEQQIGYVHKITSGVDSMSRLVNNLLDLGRIEAGVGLQIEKVAVKEVVDRVILALQAQAQQKRVSLLADISQQSIPLVDADPALLQQALQNLVENAIKYSDQGGPVQIKVSLRQERVVFEVHDSGIGIAPVDQARLFERFYRGAQQGARQQRGSGLGLAIVKSIAERHGGRVWAESQLGKGSTFYLEIPIQSPRRSKSG